MRHHILYIIFLSAISLFTTHCRSEYNDTRSYRLLQHEPVDAVRLADREHKLGPILFYSRIAGGGQFILGDVSPAIYLFDGSEMVDSFGSLGQGPCEYERPISVSLDNGWLYVLDVSAAKIVRYDVASGHCESIFSHDDLVSMTGIEVVEGKVFLLKGMVSARSPVNDGILYSLAYNDQDTTLHDVSDVKVGDIIDSLYPVPILISGSIAHSEGRLYFHPLFSNAIFIHDIDTEDTRRVTIDLGISSSFTATNVNEAISEIDNTAVVMSIHVDDDRIALVTKQETRTPNVWNVVYYDDAGRFLGRVAMDSHIIDVFNGMVRSIQIHPDNTDFPFVLTDHAVRFED